MEKKSKSGLVLQKYTIFLMVENLLIDNLNQLIYGYM